MDGGPRKKLRLEADNEHVAGKDPGVVATMGSRLSFWIALAGLPLPAMVKAPYKGIEGLCRVLV